MRHEGWQIENHRPQGRWAPTPAFILPLWPDVQHHGGAVQQLASGLHVHRRRSSSRGGAGKGSRAATWRQLWPQRAHGQFALWCCGWAERQHKPAADGPEVYQLRIVGLIWVCIRCKHGGCGGRWRHLLLATVVGGAAAAKAANAGCTDAAIEAICACARLPAVLRPAEREGWQLSFGTGMSSPLWQFLVLVGCDW